MFTTLLNFCSNDLSAFYFDIRKDIIYCDNPNSHVRRATRTLLNIIFNYLVRWFAPSISFTTEEAWKSMGNNTSIHLEDFLSCEKTYENNYINEKWSLVKNIRKVATGAIEKIREDKTIRSSLEAHLDIYVSHEIYTKIQDVLFNEITITSSYNLNIIEENSPGYELEDVPNTKVKASKVNGYKCQRCWKYEDQLINEEICKRCHDAIS
jgi:Isoleucyl-tRNA synthetase